MPDEYTERKVTVYCNTCKEWINEETTGFLDIAEDIQGRDLMSFRCPKCKEVSTSYRRG